VVGDRAGTSAYRHPDVNWLFTPGHQHFGEYTIAWGPQETLSRGRMRVIIMTVLPRTDLRSGANVMLTGDTGLTKVGEHYLSTAFVNEYRIRLSATSKWEYPILVRNLKICADQHHVELNPARVEACLLDARRVHQNMTHLFRSSVVYWALTALALAFTFRFPSVAQLLLCCVAYVVLRWPLIASLLVCVLAWRLQKHFWPRATSYVQRSWSARSRIACTNH
jgi:uncharacterized membrane protein YwzB